MATQAVYSMWNIWGGGGGGFWTVVFYHSYLYFPALCCSATYPYISLLLYIYFACIFPISLNWFCGESKECFPIHTFLMQYCVQVSSCVFLGCYKCVDHCTFNLSCWSLPIILLGLHRQEQTGWAGKEVLCHGCCLDTGTICRLVTEGQEVSCFEILTSVSYHSGFALVGIQIKTLTNSFTAKMSCIGSKLVSRDGIGHLRIVDSSVLEIIINVPVVVFFPSSTKLGALQTTYMLLAKSGLLYFGD